ncbi:tigger transposable element-derived protein 4-like [Gigantopelta aegis]|uniref:tigger transposable element-derived protein 4-like n=1 Tax=Gigantopelta aegis TaxID=1735272 RepID=UPI001B889FB8|nr:tigger transposable element-derived protein 4-like [Gigantopelta aegis]
MRQLKAYDEKQDPKISVLDDLRMVNQAWGNVTPTTIKNCFRHAEFAKPDGHPEPESKNDSDDNIPLSRLYVPIATYTSLDDYLDTCETATDDSIIDTIISARNTTPDDDDDDASHNDDTTAPPKRPTTTETLYALDVVRNRIETTETTDHLLAGLAQITSQSTQENEKCGGTWNWADEEAIPCPPWRNPLNTC